MRSTEKNILFDVICSRFIGGSGKWRSVYQISHSFYWMGQLLFLSFGRIIEMGNKFRFNYELREIRHDFKMKFKEIITLTEFGIFFFSKQQKKRFTLTHIVSL